MAKGSKPKAGGSTDKKNPMDKKGGDKASTGKPGVPKGKGKGK